MAVADTPGMTVTRTPWVIWGLSVATLLFEGYDFYVYGATVPFLLRRADWALDPRIAGAIGSASVVGMAVGSLAAGVIADLRGRRPVYLAAIVIFSAGSALSALAPSPVLLLVGRVVVGVGAGGFIPTALAMVVEYSPRHRRTRNTSVAMAGVGLGAALAGLVARWVAPSHGYQALFWIGAAPLVLLAPLAWFRAPESVSLMLTRGKIDQAREIIRRYRLPVALVPRETPADPSAIDDDIPSGRSRLGSVYSLFNREHRGATVVFWIGMIMSLLLTNGANTWLSSIMLKAGYQLSSALLLMASLNVGAVITSLLGGLIGDRRGAKVAVLASFGCAIVGLAGLAATPPVAAAYVLAALVGAGAGGAQGLLFAYAANHYRTANRGSGLGLTSSVGRVGAIAGPSIGGVLLASNATAPHILLIMAIPAVLALGVLAFGPRTRTAR